jgi:hypothetical protein
MKKNLLILSALVCFMVTISSCQKDDSSTINPYGAGNGEISFYAVSTSSPRSPYPISIVVNGIHVGDISFGYSSGAPDCGAGGSAGVASYIGTPGYQNFTATGANGGTVSGSVNLVVDQCSIAYITN